MAEKTNETVKTRGQVISELEAQGKLTAEEVAKLTDEENPIDVLTIGGIEIDFSELGAAGKTLVEAFKLGEIKIGDYINYTPSNPTASATVEKQETGVDESQTYTVDTNMSWRVLGLSEDENQLLITTESPIKRDGEDPYLSLKGAEGCYSGIEPLNKICNIYDNSELADETRTITIDDINNALGIKKDGNVIYKEADSSKTNLDEWKVLGNIYTYKSGNYAPKKYMKDIYGLDIEEEKAGDEVQSTAYHYSYSSGDVINSSSELYKVLFNGTLESDRKVKSYWIAPLGYYADTWNAGYGLGHVTNGQIGVGFPLLYSNGYCRCIRFGVRPVVLLKSNITVNQIATSNSGNQTNWDNVTVEVDIVSTEALTGEAGKIN